MKAKWLTWVPRLTLLLVSGSFIQLSAFSETNLQLGGAVTLRADTLPSPPFPTVFTNRAGFVFRNVKVQEANSDGVVVSCTNLKNIWGLEKISFQELPPEIQNYYGYNPTNPVALEERLRQLREHNNTVWQRRWEADEPRREAEQKAIQSANEGNRKRIEAIESQARKGDAESQYALGSAYYAGQGVARNYAEAVKWFRLAAEQGHVEAQSGLGFHYLVGWGVAKDLKEAARWFSEAAGQGDAGAQFNLGNMLVEGEGVSKDYVEAYKWFNLAIAGESSERVRAYYLVARRQVEQQMFPEQIAEAQRLSREFKPRKTFQAGDRSSSTNPSASGSGFFISADGFLVTNEHVVRDAAQARLVTSTGLISAKVVKVDAANDLALLKAEGKFSPLPVAASRGVKLGGTVATVGFPNIGLQGFAPKLAKGEIASLSGAADDARYFQISVPVQPGNSGGALVDERGNVVGVVSAKLSARAALASGGALPENVNYAIKSSYLLSFLESVPEVAAKLKEPLAKERKFEDVVKDAEQAAVLVLVY